MMLFYAKSAISASLFVNDSKKFKKILKFWEFLIDFQKFGNKIKRNGRWILINEFKIQNLKGRFYA